MGNPSKAHIVGRYVLYDEIAAGGMASVHLGRLLGPVGFSRSVAIKRLHAQFARDPDFVSMFVDEARLAARIRHPNVVSVIDVVATAGELFLVMEYVAGEALSRLMRASGRPAPANVALSIAADVLHGLHAAHEARGENGEPLAIVHRDVSPQNVIVGRDGLSRVLDFGVAKAASRAQATQDGQLKGKLAYMAPEQIASQPVDRRADVWAASVVLWEALTGKRLFAADDQWEIVSRVMQYAVPPPSSVAGGLSPEVDAIVLKGLEREPGRRYATAGAMAADIERLGQVVGLARPAEVGAWVESVAAETLSYRALRLAEIESDTARGALPIASSTAKLAERDDPGTRTMPRTDASTPSSQKRSALKTPSQKSAVARKVSEPKVKGSNLQAVVKALEEMRGKAVVADTLRRVRPELSEGLRLGAIVAGGWYPLEWYADLHQAAADATGEGLELAYEIGRVSTRLLFKGIYRYILYVLSPESIVSKGQRSFALFFDTGKVEVLEARTGYVRVEFTGCAGWNARLWEDVIGANEMLIELGGGKDAKHRVLSGGGKLPSLKIEHTWR